MVTNGGLPREIEEVLPEFLTGALPAVPAKPKPGLPPTSALAVSAQPQPVVPPSNDPSVLDLDYQPIDWDIFAHLFLGYLKKKASPKPRWKFQFSLRTLLIFFLFVCPILGVISNDIAATYRQQQIVNEWGGDANWERDSWRFWKSDVVWLLIKDNLVSDPNSNLSQLPKLKYLDIRSDSNNGAKIKLTKSQYEKLFSARHLKHLRLPDSCSDFDLARINELRELYLLELRHEDAHRTVRRLRHHSKLQFLYLANRHVYRSDYHLYRDIASIPGLSSYFDSSVKHDPVHHEYASIMQLINRLPATTNPFARAAAPQELFQIAILGDDTPVIYDHLRGDASEDGSDETRFTVIRKDKVDFILSILNTTHIKAIRSRYNDVKNQKVRIAGRMAWQADHVVLSIKADQVMTDTLRDHCRLIRLMEVPNWSLVTSNSSPDLEHNIGGLICECISEIGAPPTSIRNIDATTDIWLGLMENVSLRITEDVARSNRVANNWEYTIQASANLSECAAQKFSYGLLFRGSNYHQLSFGQTIISDHLSVNGHQITVGVNQLLTPGEEVAIVRDGHIYAIGTVQPPSEN